MMCKSCGAMAEIKQEPLGFTAICLSDECDECNGTIFFLTKEDAENYFEMEELNSEG